MDRGNCSVLVRRLVGAAMMLAFLATVFVPAMAASQAQPADSSSNVFSNKSIAKVVANTRPAPDAVKDAPKTTAPQATRTGSFFKTRTGVLVLAIMAVGTGYALYSVKEDRIHGANR